MDNKVIVTGGAGFVGSNLVRLLLDKGMQVAVLDNFIRGRREYLAGLEVEIIEADIRDEAALAPAFDGFSQVIHLAALGSVVESVSDPQTNFDINVRGTFNVLDAAVKAGVRKLVFSSTGGALIGNATPPVDENSLPRPISPYGAGKLCCEAYCHAFAGSYDLTTVCTRFANVYGPYSGHKTGVINRFLQRIEAGQALQIYGDGSSSRDYIHVADLCDGIYAALTHATGRSEIFHLASGRETSLRELADIMRNNAGRPDHPVEFLEARVGEVDRNFASYDHAARVLGFSPKIQLEAGLDETCNWLRQHQHSF
jgi:UDP-glucose 4-epimerase